MKIYSVISDDPFHGLGLEGTYADRSDADLMASVVAKQKRIPVIVIASELRTQINPPKPKDKYAAS